MVQFAPAVVATLYSRRATGAGVVSGMLAGAIVTTLFVVRPEWRPLAIHAGLYGVAVNVVVLAVVSLLSGRPLPESQARFLGAAGRAGQRRRPGSLQGRG